MRHYDVAVIGTGPAGQKAAIQASKLGKRVVVVERQEKLGGAAVNTGTIPSKALREAALHLTGASRRGLFGRSYRVKRDITVADLIYVSQQVIHTELDLLQDQFERNDVEVMWGTAHFEGPNLLQIVRAEEAEIVTADKFILASGTRPAKPESVPFDGVNVVCSDTILSLKKLPKSLIVVGAGVIGTEYACIMATLGVNVTLIDGKNQVLGFLDQEICESFQYQMRRAGITLRLGEKVSKIELQDVQVQPNGSSDAATEKEVEATLESGKRLCGQTLLYAVGREGTARELGLENVGLEFDDRGRLKVNEHFQTAVPHIYAAGDIIGFPALASTAMEQGRQAACWACGVETPAMTELLPYGIYAVPEISMVGKTEQQLTAEGIPFEAGSVSYQQIARGQLLGDHDGLLKLLVHQETGKLLGVHIIGTGATELIHIGQAVMSLGGDVDYFVKNVFNFPTLAEAYRVAGLRVLRKMRRKV